MLEGLGLDYLITTTAHVLQDFIKYEALADEELEPRARRIYKRALSTRLSMLEELGGFVISGGLDYEKYKTELGLPDDYLTIYKDRCDWIDVTGLIDSVPGVFYKEPALIIRRFC